MKADTKKTMAKHWLGGKRKGGLQKAVQADTQCSAADYQAAVNWLIELLIEAERSALQKVLKGARR